MKQITLKSFEIPVKVVDKNGQLIEDKQQEITYGSLYLSALNDMGEQGLRPTEMTKRLKVVGKIEKALEAKKPKAVDLEDAEFDLLYSLAKQQKFLVLHQGFIDYLDDLETAHKAEEKEDKSES